MAAATSPQRWTRLHEVSKNGDIAIVSDLLADGTDVNKRDNEERTPLHWAALNGHHETVLALLSAGANVGARDNLKRTPMHLAAGNGHQETVSALLTVVLRSQDWRESTPLHLAARNGHHETVSDLLIAGADVNAQDSELKTPLHWAALNGHHETVSALLSAGANVYRRDSGRNTPLQYATEQGHPECVGVLLQHKTNIDYRNMQFVMPIQESGAAGFVHQPSEADHDSLPHPLEDRTSNTSTKRYSEPFQRGPLCRGPSDLESQPPSHPFFVTRRELEGLSDRNGTLATLTVEHLQRFEDEESIQFHPKTTAIFGPNSSGKSTFLRAWLLFATLSHKMSSRSSDTQSRYFRHRHQQTVSNSVITDVFAISDIRDFWYRRDTTEPVTISGTDTEGNGVRFIIHYEMGGAFVKVHKMPSMLVDQSQKIVLAVLDAINRDAYKPQVPEEVPFSSFPVLTLDQSLIFSMLCELQQHPGYWDSLEEMLQSVRPGCALRIVSGGRQRGQKVVMVEEGPADIPLQICDSGLLQIVSVLVFVLHSLKRFSPLIPPCPFGHLHPPWLSRFHHLEKGPIATLLLDDISCFLEGEVLRKLAECLTNEIKCQTVVTTLCLEAADKCDKYIEILGPRHSPKLFDS